jgi:formamidopyrimidine-DNA glycosylase
LLADVRERVVTFLMEQVITAGGKVYADETVWVHIMYSD